MSLFEVKRSVSGIKGSRAITSAVHGHRVGYFRQEICQRDIEEKEHQIAFAQDNQFVSAKAVLRKLYFQEIFAHTKLVCSNKGWIYDVAVNLHSSNAAYSIWYGVDLNKEKKQKCLIPKGFGHGFQWLTDASEFYYKCDDSYHINDTIERELGMVLKTASYGHRYLENIKEAYLLKPILQKIELR